jgi:hypothetical protein
MPFTPAHAAAALPFLRSRLVPSALVVGTMAPDFEYFLRFAPGGGFGHTIPGAFLQSLPLALGVLWIFQALLKAPLVQLFPDGIRLRIRAHATPFRFGGPGRFFLIVVSALLGIATHLLLDMFTHHDTWATRHIPWLNEEVRLPILRSASHASILQLITTVAGILLLCAWFWHWYRTTMPISGDKEPGIPASRRYLALGGIVGAGCIGGMIRAALAMTAPGRKHWVVIAGNGATTAIALTWWVLVLYAAIPARRWSRVEVQR